MKNQNRTRNVLAIFNHVSFSTALVVVFAAFAVIATTIFVRFLNEYDQRVAITNAIRSAKTTSDNINHFRSYYSGEIVQPALQNGVNITHLFRETPNSIPLPATMSIDLGNYLTLQNSSIGYKMFSNFPFEWRSEREIDDIEKNILDSDYVEEKVIFSENGDLRLFSPVVMEENCVACHNSLEYSPKKDWAVGDIRGYQEIIYPAAFVNEASHRAPLLDRFLVFVLVSFFVGIGIILILANINNRAFNRVRDFAQKEKTNASKLEVTNKALSESLEQLQSTKNNEKLLSLVAERTDNAVIITDADGKVSWVNAGFVSMTGYSLEEMVGKNPGEVLQGPKTDSSTVEQMARSIKDRIGFSVDILNYTKSGKEYWVSIDTQPIFNEGGKILAFIAIERDISAEKQKQNSLEMARVSAEESNELKSQFVAMMSHEIRTPINGLLGALGLIKDSKLNKDQEYYMDLAKSCADSLLFLVNDVLDYSKIEAGKLEIEDTTFSISEMLHSVSDIILPRALDQGLELFIVNGFPENTLFDGDPSRIRQVLLNLLSNSLKFTDKGSITVEVEPLQQGKGNQLIKFVVKDTGEGIASEDHDKLFEKFVTLKPVYKHNHVGTGLGLSISKSLVELMGGEIGFSSVVGVGTEFWFTVPMGNKREVPSPVIAPLIEEVPSNLSGRILLAEDNPANQIVAREILSRAGLEVDVVSDGREAVASVERRRYDLILMDIGMPGVDGIAATRTIRDMKATSSKVPIIAMTAHVKKGDRESLLEQGMSDYLAKPVSKQKLLSMVGKWLQAAQVKTVDKNGLDSSEELGSALPLVDLSKLQATKYDVGADLLVTLANMFGEQVAEANDQILRAVRNNDPATAADHAHKLKGSSSTLALSKLTVELQTFEDLCKTGGNIELEPAANRIKELSLASHEELLRLI